MNELTGRNVLVVDDNDMNMKIACYALHKAGATYAQAMNGREAVEAFRDSNEKEYDVILMDIMMPVMDGVEATREIRATNRGDAQTVPIIAVTANTFSDDIEYYLEAGMNSCVGKPFYAEKLIEEIQALI